MARTGDRLPHAAIAEVRPSIERRVCVDDLAPLRSLWNPHSIALARYGCHVADDKDGRDVAGGRAQESEDRIGAVVAHDPGEALRVAIASVQCRFPDISKVEITQEAPHALVLGVVGQVPVDLAVVAPFPLLRDLAAHEDELLAGVTPHEPEIGAHIREATPAISRHAAEKRTLAVDDLVM